MILKVLIDLVILITSILNKIQIRQVKMTELVIFLMNPEHKIQKLVKKHETVFEANVIVQVIQIKWHGFLEFRDQESEIQAVLNYRLGSQLCMMQHWAFVLLIANLFSQKYFWL